jgi:hypothetical protein
MILPQQDFAAEFRAEGERTGGGLSRDAASLTHRPFAEKEFPIPPGIIFGTLLSRRKGE